MSEMQIGIHCFVWNDGQSQSDLETAIEKTAEAGFGLLELPGINLKEVRVDLVAKRAQQLGLKLAASAGLPPDCDVSSDDPEKVKRGVAVIEEQLKAARDLGSDQLSGPIFSGHQKFATMPTRKNWDTSVGVISRAAEKAKAMGVALCLEILNRYETNVINTVAQGLAFIKETGSDNAFLHLDTYHMNIEEADSAAAIRLAGSKIGYFHVGENHRGFLGSGQINFAPSFDALVEIGYSKNVSVEAFNARTNGDWLKAICAIWRENWTGDMEFARHSKAFIEMQIADARRRAAAYRKD